jgi:hypothetical protein
MRQRDFPADGQAEASALVAPMGATPEAGEHLRQLLRKKGEPKKGVRDISGPVAEPAEVMPVEGNRVEVHPP